MKMTYPQFAKYYRRCYGARLTRRQLADGWAWYVWATNLWVSKPAVGGAE